MFTDFSLYHIAFMLMICGIIDFISYVYMLILYHIYIYIYFRKSTWIFIGRTDAEAEDPILWLADAKSQLIGKDPDAGKD